MRNLLATFFVVLVLCSSPARAGSIRIELEVPAIDANPYHTPYIAVWLETGERKPVATLAVWHERDTWLKDLRQWWRKIGRAGQENLDAVTGATRKPGRYSIVWQALDSSGKALAPGRYLLNFEASREEGDRSYFRQEVTLGSATRLQLPAKGELGEITIVTE